MKTLKGNYQDGDEEPTTGDFVYAMTFLWGVIALICTGVYLLARAL